MVRTHAWRFILLFLVALLVPVLLLDTVTGRADERRHGAVKLLDVIPATACLTCGNDSIAIFDISWVDAASRRLYLADRSNNAVDVVDTRTNTYLKQIQKGIFKGFTGNNNTSGPNGVVVSGHWLFVTDAPSKVWSIDLRTDTVADVVQTDPVSQNRTDEVAYDPADGVILAVNNADSPPFATLIKVNKQTGTFILPTQRITFPFATNGAEQPVWNPRTGKFYVSIPEVNGPGDGSGPDGAVAVITLSGNVTLLAVERCQPAGLTLGPDNQLLLGCSETFDASGNHWDPANPTPNPTPKQVILNFRNGHTTDVFGVGGSDEVWFNPGDGRYYTASRNNPEGPVLGVIDAEDRTLVQVVPTVTPPKGSAHSVAADPVNNHVFVALPANNRINDCSRGCFGVYGVVHDDD